MKAHILVVDDDPRITELLRADPGPGGLYHIGGA